MKDMENRGTIQREDDFNEDFQYPMPPRFWKVVWLLKPVATGNDGPWQGLWWTIKPYVKAAATLQFQQITALSMGKLLPNATIFFSKEPEIQIF